MCCVLVTNLAITLIIDLSLNHMINKYDNETTTTPSAAAHSVGHEAPRFSQNDVFQAAFRQL